MKWQQLTRVPFPGEPFLEPKATKEKETEETLQEGPAHKKAKLMPQLSGPEDEAKSLAKSEEEKKVRATKDTKHLRK